MSDRRARPEAAQAPSAEQTALAEALRAVLTPLARLAVARGLGHGVVDEMLRAAFVAAAHAAHPDLPGHRRVSRISAATGINRREVTRLVGAPRDAPPRLRSYPNEVFAHWTTDPQYLDARGRPRRLPRLGPAPSFESLAQSVTRDMHPRSLLEELRRLGLATHEADDDSVALTAESFVPRGDRDRLDNLLGANVGDHLAASVANVLAGGGEHFEQALFADGLSAQSVDSIRSRVAAHWRALTAELVPVLEKLIENDARAGVTADQRLRVGLFSYQEGSGPAPAAAPIVRPRRTPTKPRRPQGER